jgi:hypothetical protein
MSNITLILISILCFSLTVALGLVTISKQLSLISKQLSLLIDMQLNLSRLLEGLKREIGTKQARG